MQLLSGNAAVTQIKGILHAQYQVHGFSIHLTVRNISSLDSNGQVDFGGGEYVAAGRTEIVPQQLRLEDKYLWWDLSHGSYIVQCNETLHLAPDEIALIEPEDRLLRAGASHVPLFVRGHIDPVELLLDVGVARLRVKQNARITRVRLFRIEGSITGSASPRKSSAKSPKRANKKK
jgi:deoxycytidine triphosphate deaminase